MEKAITAVPSAMAKDQPEKKPTLSVRACLTQIKRQVCAIAARVLEKYYVRSVAGRERS